MTLPTQKKIYHDAVHCSRVGCQPVAIAIFASHCQCLLVIDLGGKTSQQLGSFVRSAGGNPKNVAHMRSHPGLSSGDALGSPVFASLAGTSTAWPRRWSLGRHQAHRSLDRPVLAPFALPDAPAPVPTLFAWSTSEPSCSLLDWIGLLRWCPLVRHSLPSRSRSVADGSSIVSGWCPR